MQTRETRRGLILFGHGARDPQWAQPMRAVASILAQGAPELRIELAFLEFIAPTLAEAVDRLARDCDRVTVVPMFIAQAGHLKRDVPELIDQARARHPALALELAAPIGESTGVLEAMAAYAAACARG